MRKHGNGLVPRWPDDLPESPALQDAVVGGYVEDLIGLFEWVDEVDDAVLGRVEAGGYGGPGGIGVRRKRRAHPQARGAVPKRGQIGQTVAELFDERAVKRVDS